jgi:CheY-like chemotaxis protein
MGAEERGYIEASRDSAGSLLTLLNDLLDFSKMESGELPLAVQCFSLREMAESSLRPLRIIAARKGLAVQMSVDDTVPDMLMGDATRLRQILVNLVGNAVKFTPSGSVGLEVKRESGGDKVVELLFSVSDTGIGIPPDKLEMIFEAFRQVDGTYTRQYGGTGLGLTICRSLLKLMNGRIWAESSSQGSRFHFQVSLPVAEARGDRAAAPDAGEVIGYNLRILVAEDNPVNQLVARRLLERQGHTVTVASNGQEAVDMFEQKPFDLVLMDVQMPLVDGFSATEAIRRREPGKRTPIVAMTAHATDGYKERCLAAGMDGYLPKPVDGSQLQQMIRELCGRG